ncbi:MAG: hypothetical protein HZA31_00465 [Opitutae bacterium]|nr:hypothetical protein [Opitutae bacterium]
MDWPAIRARSTAAPWSVYRDATLRFADHLLTAPAPRIDTARHNWVLEQARVTGKYIITLAGAYRLTRDARYAERAWFFFADALEWPHWFWLGDPRTQGFALSTGELAITCAFMEDWMGDFLSPERRAAVDRAIGERIFAPYLEVTAPGREVVWYRDTINWNAVCNGGVLVLALQRAAHDPLSAAVIAHAEEGLRYYLAGLSPDGSLPESIGYWQYGMVHLAYALLASERYTGKPHPTLATTSLNSGLSFPFDFTPEGGTAVGFGDCNIFFPQGFLFAMAARAGRDDITAEMHRRMTRYLRDRTPAQFNPFEDYHPTEIFCLVFSGQATADAWNRPACKVYPDVGWGVFASGPLTLGFRAGSTAVSHSMRDLCAVNLARGGVGLFEYVENLPYTRGWFNYERPRGNGRELFFEDNSTSKNTLLTNGVGQIERAVSQWGADATSMWCEAGAAYAWFVRRVYRRVEQAPGGFILHDDVETDAECWHEARFFTRGEFVELGEGRFRVSHAGQSAELLVRAAVPMHCVVVEAAQSIPVKPTLRMLRIANRLPACRSQWQIHITA